MDKFSDLFEDWNDDFEKRKELTSIIQLKLVPQNFLA